MDKTSVEYLFLKNDTRLLILIHYWHKLIFFLILNNIFAVKEGEDVARPRNIYQKHCSNETSTAYKCVSIYNESADIQVGADSGTILNLFTKQWSRYMHFIVLMLQKGKSIIKPIL